MEVLSIWQDAMEICYYDEVLNGIQKKKYITSNKEISFQAIAYFCSIFRK